MELRAENICKKYFRETASSNFFYALKETELTLKEGSLSVLMGRSGCGKTTLLSMLAGLLTPTEGSVVVGDTDIYRLSDKELSVFRNKNIGVVPQGNSALYNLNVIENVTFPAMLYGSSTESEVSKRAFKLLEIFGIDELKKEMPAVLSGGELRRVAISRALINAPDILLADEPTGDLDDENTTHVFKVFRRMADQGVTVLIVTHEPEAAQYADVIYRMDAGNISKKQ